MSLRLTIGLLIAAVALSYSYFCDPIYDNHGHTGDESASLTLAYNASTTGVPTYGYTKEGRGWAQGIMTLPLSSWAYGLPLEYVAPINRLAAARAISRLLNGLSFFLCLNVIAIGYAARKPRRFSWETVVATMSALSVGYLFLFTENFVFIGSFGRIDAIGLFAVCAYVTTLALYYKHKTDAWLFFAGIVGILSYFVNFIAGVICAASLAVTLIQHVLHRPLRLRLRRAAVVTGSLVAFFVMAFMAFNFVILNVHVIGDDRITYTNMLGKMAERVRVTTATSLVEFLRWHWEVWKLAGCVIASSVAHYRKGDI